MSAPLLDAYLSGAVYPLTAPPIGAAWNREELDGMPQPNPLLDAAVLVGVVNRAHGAAVLLTRRCDGLRQHAGQVSFPGGRVDPGDASAVAAALREAHEEIGLSPNQVNPLGYLDPLQTITGFRVLPVVATIADGFVPHPSPAEVAEVFEVPLALLMDPDQLESVSIEFAGRRRRVFQYRYAEQRIWGATASILYNLRERLTLRRQGSR